MMSIETIASFEEEAGQKARANRSVPFVPARKATAEQYAKKIPNLGSYRPQGWAFQESKLVDKSGFGAEDEPALTIGQLGKWIEDGMSEGYGYAIISEGQFQVDIARFTDVNRKEPPSPPMTFTTPEKPSETWKHIASALDGRVSRKIGNNTYVKQHDDGSVTILLHATHILRAHSNGTVTVDCKGYRSATTKDRLNVWLADGLGISQEAGVWYWHQRGNEFKTLGMFTDGDVIHPDGHVAMLAGPEDIKNAKKLSKDIGAFAKKCAIALPLEPPSSGDCLYCQVELQGTKPDASHLLSHMEEGYVVPSLVINALHHSKCAPIHRAAAFGAAPQFVGITRDTVRRAVRRYLKTRLTIAS